VTPIPPAETTSRDEERAEVQAVRAALQRSPLVARLFSYVCEKYFAGEAGQLHEVKIAVDVFGRKEDFDRNQDAIARVEAHRLRKKLKQYYESEGKDHALHIELPPGSYAPVFRRTREGLHAAGHDAYVKSAGDALPVDVPPARPPQGREMRPKAKYVWWIIAAAVVALSIFALPRMGMKQGGAAARAASGRVPVAEIPAAAALGQSGAVRLLCGYSGPPHIGRLGEVWGADKYYNGGRPWPARHGFIRRANDPFLFENTRTGEFSYDIPAKPGFWELHLYFVETEYGEELGGGENTRTMLIRLNGGTLFQSFDPISDAGGPRIADERIFKDVEPAEDGKVHVSFESQRGQPMISAIELLPGMPHKQFPIRLVTQVNSYTDHAGQIWAPDNYYVGGQFFTDKPSVSGTADPTMFASERAGNFTYAIPVDVRGTYTANLYFAETYFGPEASGVGGAGSRVFNVTCDGVTLLDRFDIFKEAGGLRAVEKSFHGLRANGQGKLLLSFEPMANYASVFAIEVLDEAR
jgi:hypothetical protein